MSTTPENVTDNNADRPADNPNDNPQQPARKRSQTPYKPVLATLVKRAMEDSVQDAIEAQQIMEALLNWSEEMRMSHTLMMEQMEIYSPLDHRLVAIAAAEKELLLRFGSGDHYLARLALAVTRLERRLQNTLTNSRRAAPPKRERRSRKKKGENAEAASSESIEQT